MRRTLPRALCQVAPDRLQDEVLRTSARPPGRGGLASRVGAAPSPRARRPRALSEAGAVQGDTIFLHGLEFEYRDDSTMMTVLAKEAGFLD